MQKFTTDIDRRSEYFDEGSLQRQFGAAKEQWPLMLTKELIDNGLDACEKDGIDPVITVTLEQHRLTIADNGRGLPASTIESSLDYSKRTSSNVAFVAPSRGQLGNALKLLWAASYVATRAGRVTVESCGKRHVITAKANPLTDIPDMQISDPVVCDCEGTTIAIDWPDVAESFRNSLYDAQPPLHRTLPELLHGFAAGNPHAVFHLVRGGDRFTFSNPTPAKRKPLEPKKASHPHWYSAESWRRLLAAYIRDEQRKLKTVREFLNDFGGLSGTKKQGQIAEQAGLSGKRLADLFDFESESFRPAIEDLRLACNAAASAFEPLRLGQLGEQCLASFLEPFSDDEKTYYRKFAGDDASGGAVMPYAFELAWTVRPEDEDRLAFILLNGSPVFKIPAAVIDSAFYDAKLSRYDPIALVLSLRCPEFSWDDTGKQQIALPAPIAQSLRELITDGLKSWTRKKAAAERDINRSAAQRMKGNSTKRTIKSVVWEVLPDAYMQASNGNELPANARQIFYQTRPLAQRLGIHDLKYKTFSELLSDFVDAYPDLTEDWDVVFDARGNGREPHTGKGVALGTKGVRKYISQWRSPKTTTPSTVNMPLEVTTCGPQGRFGGAIYIEKEGFDSLLDKAQVAERYDLKIFSGKGIPTTAARRLTESLSDAGIPVFVVHDFDADGFKAFNTLRESSKRYRFDRVPNVIDLGLRLKDIQIYSPEWETQPWNQESDPRPRLRSYGCTEDEIDFLCDRQDREGRWHGSRIELNALSAEDFLHWLESRLQEHGVKKVLPDEATLAAAYRRAVGMRLAQEAAEAVLANFDPSVIDVPPQLARKVQDAIEGKAIPWDEAIADLVRADD